MYVVIVGAGEVGSYVARILVQERHEVVIVETDEEVARRLDASLDALVVAGSGVDPATLRRAGIERADLLLAVTAMDEVNLIVCMTARKYGDERLRTVARVRQSREGSADLALSAADLGLDAIVTPEQSVAVEAIEALRYVGSGEMREVIPDRLVLVGMDLGADSPLVHETVADVRRDFATEFVVAAVQGPEGVRIPSGTDRLAAGERAFLLTVPGRLTELAILSGQPWHQARRVLLVGCGSIGLELARRLEAEGLEVVVMERDGARAELVAGMLPRSLVLHADGTDPEQLRARIQDEEIDAIAVMLEEPEVGMLTGIFAKSLGARKVVVRCDEAGFIPFANALGVDAAFSPQRAMAGAILRYVRQGPVQSALLLGEHEAELLQFPVGERPAWSDLIRRPLGELDFPAGTLVGAVVRGEQVLFGSGDLLLQPGDQVLMVSRAESLPELEKLLAG